MKEAAEKAKIELSSSSSTEINLPYIMPVDGVPQHLVRTLTRSQFEQLTDRLIQATLEPCRKALADAGLTTSDIDEVILVGAIGLSLTLIHLVSIPVTNTSVNPARSIAAAVLDLNANNGLTDLWIFIVAPCAGAVVAALIWRCISGECCKKN